jgi:hypothetical protein
LLKRFLFELFTHFSVLVVEGTSAPWPLPQEELAGPVNPD